MVNKDMNGFPVKKCSAFQFFKKRVRRWIKSPMVSVDKHQSPGLKYTSSSMVHIPPGESHFEPSLYQTCLGDHDFHRGMLPQEKESCSWETQSGCEVKEPCNHASILTKPDPRTYWTNDDSEIAPGGAPRIHKEYQGLNTTQLHERQMTYDTITATPHFNILRNIKFGSLN